MAKKTSRKTAKKPAAKATASKAPSKKAASKKSSPFSLITQAIEGFLPSKPQDVVGAIKQDHDALRNYLGLLKDTEKPMNERHRAYKSFSELLKSHTIAEEQAVYENTTELTGRDLHVKTAEGYVEHQLAEDLMKRIEREKDAMIWGAHCNVLSEIVEHHLKEEERDLLPLIRKKAPVDLNMEMLTKFLSLRAKTQKRSSGKNAGVLK